MSNPSILPRTLELSDLLTQLIEEHELDATIQIFRLAQVGWVVAFTGEQGIPIRCMPSILRMSGELDLEVGWSRDPQVPPTLIFRPLASLHELGSPL